MHKQEAPSSPSDFLPAGRQVCFVFGRSKMKALAASDCDKPKATIPPDPISAWLILQNILMR
jgi:hypothetical protein